MLITCPFTGRTGYLPAGGRFEREGVTIPRSTQTSWLLQCYEAIKPLGEVLKEVVLDSGYLFTDDTPIPLQVKGHGRVKKGRLWVYVRGGPGPPHWRYMIFPLTGARGGHLIFLMATVAMSLPDVRQAC